ncbi:hypothetical protein BJX63DRAFT_430335 [Aspergillus granulosus]|uniref:Uncharacterized protein n=1 Tax=Aspergillus granulosus TaxID=176169 RepID=A0ABR4HNN0_9EURO
MRLRLINRSLLHSSTNCCRRSFHHAFLRARTPDPTIFENSLEKTLEEHRSVNRQSLIRKVMVGPASPKPEPLTVPSEPLIEEPPKPKSAHQASTKKRIVETQKTRARLSGDRIRSTYRNINWKPRGKPEQCPWLDHLGPHTCSGGISQLDGEIRGLDKYMTTTTQESEVIRRIVSEITGIVNKSVRRPLQIIGSRRTGFQMSHSNLNLMLQVKDPARSPNNIRKPSATRLKNLRHYHKLLITVSRALAQHPDYAVHFDQGLKAGIEAIHQPTGVHLHLSCGEELPAYIEYTQDFLAEYPSLRPLYVATRLILETRGLFGSARSSIDPVALQILLTAFLKMNHGRFQRTSAGGSYAEPLLAFLHTFGSEINLSTTGIAVDPPGFFDADSVRAVGATPTMASTEYEAEGNIFPAYVRGQRALITAKKNAAVQGNKALSERLCVQDPANYLRDLGGSCTRTVEIQATLANAYTRLKAALDAWRPSNPGGGDGHLRQSILSCVLRANFEDFEARRAKIVLSKTK